MNPFVKLNKQYIGGEWRDGSSAKVLTDRNPYNDKPICDIKLANLADLDAAYRSAAAAQKIWMQINPFERRAILEKAITFVEKNEAEITDIIIEELGGTGLKAFFEIGLVKNIIKEAVHLSVAHERRDPSVGSRRKRKQALPGARGSCRRNQSFQFSILSEHALGGDGAGSREWRGSEAARRHSHHRGNAGGARI